MAEQHVAVVGGGLVGMALAYGLLSRGCRVTVFDEGDDAFRASRGNFGLVWMQSKGAELPNYARWTRRSTQLWPELASQLARLTGTDVGLAQPGGLDFALSEEELAEKVARLEQLRGEIEDYPFEVIGRNRLKEMVPEVGPEVVGATYGPEDGHVNPLRLLRALHEVFARLGGRRVAGEAVREIQPLSAGFLVDNGARHQADKVVLAAGLGNAALAAQVGLDAPVKPNRGQVLVTERVRPFLKYPTSLVRQVDEGGVQIGDSKEDAGLDDATSAPVVGHIASRAIRLFPLLKDVRIVRSWAALRVMSPDGYPIYEESPSHPGAYLVTCHSGVTLAAAHAELLAPWIAEGAAPPYLESFRAGRFRLHTAA